MIHQALAHRAPARKKTGGKDGAKWPLRMVLGATRQQVLRYGENPHQAGVLYRWAGVGGGAGGGGEPPAQLHGKELSFNNLLDLDAAVRLVSAFKRPSAVVLKHNNPCGAASADSLTDAFRRAHGADSMSAFGGVVGLNRPVDREAAQAIVDSGFLECVVAPDFRPEALQILRAKKNLRIIKDPAARTPVARCVDLKQVAGGLLAQDPDAFRKGPPHWRLVSGARPSETQQKDLQFAWTVARFARSNAVIIAKGERTVGIGAGLTSRVDSVRFALRKAGERAKGAVLASDGFFPKPDGPQAAVRAGVKAIVQPGGSVQDPQVIQVAKKAGVTMLLTGKRHFLH